MAGRCYFASHALTFLRPLPPAMAAAIFCSFDFCCVFGGCCFPKRPLVDEGGNIVAVTQSHTESKSVAERQVNVGQRTRSIT